VKKTLFATPQDAEAAFYEAFMKHDLDAMMSVWADDDEVYCVHPRGPRVTGVAQVRESWRQIFFAIAACSWMPHWACHYYRLETNSSFVVGSFVGSTRKTDRHSGQDTFTCPP